MVAQLAPKFVNKARTTANQVARQYILILLTGLFRIWGRA